MMNQKMIDTAIASENDHQRQLRQNSKERKAKVRKIANLIKNLEFKTGLDLPQDAYGLRYNRAIVLRDVADLHEIKKVVGDVIDSGQGLADDYNTTNELVITVRPEKGLYDILRFSYRRKHTASDGCQVVRQSDQSYDVLVCPNE